MIISDWLASSVKDYEKGVELFKENGGSAVVLRLLVQGKNSFTSTLLEEELRKLISSPGANTDLEDEPDQPTSQPPGNTFKTSPEKEEEDFEEVADDLPEEIIALKKERQRLYRERDFMKAKLPHVRGNNRAKYAIKIVTNTYRIDDIWTAIDHYKATGVFMNPDKEQKRSARDMFKVEREINNARSNISKHRKSGKLDLLAKWEGILKQLEVEKKEILNAV